MKQQTLWLDSPQIGCGFYTVLIVREGTRHAHCLHVPTLTYLKLPLKEIAAQVRRGIAPEIPLRRGTLTALRDKRRQYEAYGYRLPGAIIEEAIEGLRSSG